MKKRAYALAKCIREGTEEQRKWDIINRVKNKTMNCRLLESVYRMMVINYDIDSFENKILKAFEEPCSDESCVESCTLRKKLIMVRIKYMREMQN
jgi:hypothetical protein